MTRREAAAALLSDAEISGILDANGYTAEDAETTRPQVYVNVSGGIAEATVTRGDVEVILVDWDMFRDGDEAPGQIAETRADILRVADSEYRALLLRDIDHIALMREIDR